MGRRIRGQPSADEAETAIDRDVVAIAENRDRQIDRRRHADFARLGLGELDRPAGIAVLVAELGRLALPVRRHSAGLDVLLLRPRVALARRSHQAGIDDLARHGDVAGGPQHCIEAINSGRIAPALVSLSRKSQIVRASGTRSDSPSPRKRMNDRRSLMRYSARSSDNVFTVWITRTLNIIT